MVEPFPILIQAFAPDGRLIIHRLYQFNLYVVQLKEGLIDPCITGPAAVYCLCQLVFRRGYDLRHFGMKIFGPFLCGFHDTMG